MLLRTSLISATLLAVIASAHGQTRTDQMPSPDRAQTQPTPSVPAGREGAVGTTGDATSGAGAVRREQQSPASPIAPGTGGGREHQVPQMDRE